MSYPEYICVLDFEATCEENVKYFDNEIIEFPSVLLHFDGMSYVVVSEFQQFCKPLKNPIVGKFCNELTGITQQQVDNGNNFVSVLSDHHKWLINETGGNVIILTCGFWDLGTVMISECKKWKILPPKIYLKFININIEFKKFYKITHGAGMKKMLDFLNITLEGHHHSGIDDCRNISKIWKRMVDDGYVLSENSINLIDSKLYKVCHPNSAKEKLLDTLRKERLKKND